MSDIDPTTQQIPTPQAAGTPQGTPEGSAPAPVAPRPRAPAEGITAQGLTERIRRAEETARKKLLEQLGIDDPEKGKAALAEAQKLRAESEERKRAEMTEIERYKADLEKARLEAEEAKREAREAREQVDYEKRDSMIRGTASKYVSDKFIRTARVEFKAYVESLSASQQGRLTDRDMEFWMRRFAKENPEMARQPGEPTTTKPTPIPVVKKPLSNGLTPRRIEKPGQPATPPAGGAPAKHPRDMTPNEVNKLARESGLRAYKANPNVKAN